MSEAVPVLFFAYGSLVDRASAEETLGHSIDPVRPAVLPGWRRRWIVCRDNHRCEKTFAPPGGDPPDWVLGLSIEPDDGAETNGALLALEPADLDRLDVREMRYERVSVRVRVGDPSGGGEADAVTYRVKAENCRVEAPPGAVILRPYLERVESAFAALGPDQLERFTATTGPPPVPVIEAELIRDRIPPGNPRRW